MARLLKFNNEVVYEHLLTPEVPFELDYCEVVFSLCDVMCRIYAMFMEEVRNCTLLIWRCCFCFAAVVAFRGLICCFL